MSFNWYLSTLQFMQNIFFGYIISNYILVLFKIYFICNKRLSPILKVVMNTANKKEINRNIAP